RKEIGLGRPRRSEQRLEPVAERSVRRIVEREVIHVELEAAVAVEPDELLHLVDVTGDPEGRHPHHLVLPLIHLESQNAAHGLQNKPTECGKRISLTSRISVPRPTPRLAVVHSPTPSTVRIAASSNGEQKKVLAAWDK